MPLEYCGAKAGALIQVKVSPDFFWTRAASDLNWPVRKSLSLQTLLAIGLAILFAACHRSAQSDAAARHYDVRGVVRGFSPDRQTIEIEHENIPGFMPSMTMPFSARDPREIVDLKTGDPISFRMTVTEKDFWIDRVRKIDRNEVKVAEPRATPLSHADQTARLHDGDEMPVFSLTGQDGERITPESLRGRPFLLTFVFTRCPIPNFCPRMSGNFAELQSAIKAGADELARTRLLSITLDPGFDTPQILKEYGAHLKFDPAVWSFATGDAKEIDALTQAFSVYRQTEGGTISHGLATALVDKNGKIVKIWRGNGWTPAEVCLEIGLLR